MAMADTRRRTRATCSYADCDREFDTADAHAGSYCSRPCRLRADGRSLLRDIEHDHTFCGTCFRLLKEIDRPTQRYIRLHHLSHLEGELVGYEDLTPAASLGPYGVECVCGSVGGTREDALRALEAWPRYLTAASQHLEAKGARDDTLTARKLRRAYERTGDLRLSVGFALE